VDEAGWDKLGNKQKLVRADRVVVPSSMMSFSPGMPGNLCYAPLGLPMQL